jgi:multisubunit Na+/H+ antiporter MnhG subunit
MSLGEIFGWALSVLDHFWLNPIITAMFVVVVAAVGARALIRALRE